MVFIVLSVLQFQENNEYRLVNCRVSSIVHVLKCLELTLVEHRPRVNEITTSQSKIVFRFEFIIKNCGNNTVVIVLTVSSVYYLFSKLLIQNLVVYQGFQTHTRHKILLFD